MAPMALGLFFRVHPNINLTIGHNRHTNGYGSTTYATIFDIGLTLHRRIDEDIDALPAVGALGGSWTKHTQSLWPDSRMTDCMQLPL